MNTQSPYKILNAYFVETGTCPDMAARNLTTQITNSSVNDFAFATEQGNYLTPDNMAGFAGNILISDPNSERVVNIQNGWRSTRLRFVLRVGIPGVQHSPIYFYTGYTDFNGWNTQVKDFDPNMRMHFNGVTQVTQAVRMTPQGQEPYVQVIECNHLLHPSNLGTQPGMWQTQFDPTQMGVQNQPSALRPYDLMNALATREHQLMAGDFGVPTIDSRPSIDIMKIDRRNAVPSNYLSRSVEGLAMGFAESVDNTGVANNSRAYEAAAGKLSELNPFSDRFLNPMIVDMGLQANGFVSWAQMVALHPELHYDGVTQVNVAGPSQAQDMYVSDASNFDSMVGDRRMATDFNNRVMASLPGMMLSSLIVFARIHVTNMTENGSIQCFIRDPISFVDIPQGFLIDRIPFLQEKFKSLIFNDLGIPPHLPFDAHFTVDSFGESFGSVSINCEPAVPYTAPSYADGMTTQMVSPNGATLPKMANDINYLVSSTC